MNKIIPEPIAKTKNSNIYIKLIYIIIKIWIPKGYREVVLVDFFMI
jgi:hypothetical protein